MVFTVHRPCHPCGSGPQGLTSCLLWNYRIYSTGETIALRVLEDDGAGRGVPDPQAALALGRPVVEAAGRGDPFSVGADRHAVHASLQAFEAPQLAPRRGL